MNESEIWAAIGEHQQRNLALAQRLIDYGINLDEPRPIDIHFFVPNDEAAHKLINALPRIGLHETRIDGSDPSDGWISLTSTINTPVAIVLSLPFLEACVRIADEFEGTHDGWGTAVDLESTPSWPDAWRPITSEDGAQLMAELRRELHASHLLSNKQFHIIARRADSDDVLLRLGDDSIAEVHLTWHGKTENDPTWPHTTLFANLDEWLQSTLNND